DFCSASRQVSGRLKSLLEVVAQRALRLLGRERFFHLLGINMSQRHCGTFHRRFLESTLIGSSAWRGGFTHNAQSGPRRKLRTKKHVPCSALRAKEQQSLAQVELR